MTVYFRYYVMEYLQQLRLFNGVEACLYVKFDKI
jgi:hypothetical protein